MTPFRTQLTALFLLATVLPAHADFTENPGFETGDTTAWTSTGFVGIAASNAASGTFSAFMITWGAGVTQGFAPTAPDSLCSASFWCKGDGGAYIMNGTNADGSATSVQGNFSATTDWVEVDLMPTLATLQSGAVIHDIFIYRLDGPSQTRIDDIEIGSSYGYDSGTTTLVVGSGASGHIAWLQSYDSGAGDVIRSIETSYGSATFPGGIPDGLPVQLGIWDDPTNDSNPDDAVLLWIANTTTSNGSTDVLNEYQVWPPVAVSGTFFIGAVCEHETDQLPGPFDSTYPGDGRSWAGYNLGGAFDMQNLSNNSMFDMDTGLSGVWMIRASCGDENLGTPYCTPGGANSVSPGGAVLACLSNYGTLHSEFQVTDMPDQPGILFAGPLEMVQPFGCGQRCVGGQIVRYQVVIGTGGSAVMTVDMSPAPLSKIQFWYRDPANFFSCGSAFNLSNAMRE